MKIAIVLYFIKTIEENYMLPQEFIRKKRDGESHTLEEFREFFSSYLRDEIPDYQVSAWLMAVCFRGMSEEEALNLTQVMAESGEILDLSKVAPNAVDKHSTGGVGDKTSIVLVPLMAHLGLKIAKMSGRGLGHSGGTIDKLESIPGFKTSLNKEEIFKGLERVGCVMVSQSKDLAPLDGKLYALRDVTATVESIPLIASSIMSKKLAGGAKSIVLDVKVGKGAFMKTLDKALALSYLMVDIGKKANRNVVAILSQMDEPLGNKIGNNLEIMEAIDTLKGKGPADLVEVVTITGAYMLLMGERVKTVEEGKELISKTLESGQAVKKFAQMVAYQGGNPKVVDDYSLLPHAQYKEIILSPETGFVKEIDAYKVGVANMIIGAGRRKKDDEIDYGAGIVVKKKIGDKISLNEPIFDIYCSDDLKVEEAAQYLENAFIISQEPVPPSKHILEIIS
ncbi:MAG: Pyrimidine-nucleoside phosphorylase [candidate division WS2 bacterium]|nr:Pyrimidine-nucleoside phosphorylase [Candidatus Lithacetigena glycinireducens]